jgi:hypothetical protein
MPARACGATRTVGGLYLVCPLSPNGKPIENFLLDPPIVQDWKDMGVTEIGMKAIQDKEGVTHMIDVVGSNNYPNVADFIEEVRHFGLSRRVSGNFNFEQLTSKSRIILLHKRAMIENAHDYNRQRSCPKGVVEHRHDKRPMCAGLWWEDVEPGPLDKTEEVGRALVRTMPAFSYEAQQRPGGIVPEYKMAAFANFPIYGIEVINDPDGGKHSRAMEAAKKASINVNLVDE